MPFVYKPSLWGFAAAAIFIVLTAIEVKEKEWVDAVMWALLGFSFAVKYLPKFLVFSLPGSLAALVTLVAGAAMFIADASNKLQS